MNKLYRDMILDGSSSAFDEEKINAQLKSITNIQEEAYKLGIDHCITEVKNSMVMFSRNDELWGLIEKLEDLKKKQ